MERALMIMLLVALSSCVTNPPTEVTNKSGNISKYEVIEAQIPVTYYGTVDGVYLGYQIAPHNVALKARESFYSYFKKKNKSDLERGIFLTEWLISNATSHGNFVVWEYSYEWPPYNLSRGWTGSLAQAGCLKAIMLAYQATGDKRYLEFAEKALAAFEVEVSQGGLLVLRKENNKSYYWYPEYAKESPPFVLNGFITALIWLEEYHNTIKNPLAGELYGEGIKSLIHYLPSYDCGEGCSYYDTLQHKASKHYHKMHVEQMLSLYKLTGDIVFLEYHEKWKKEPEK
ncbi:MAG: D-glucuronyl C5-epimerase family protein [Candidatus Hydrothermarchaeota archaeon]|nr:D-glucuronyl C5-epimerase family protein [Candidatus Hydrothermarchaeota archaeon]